MIVVYDGECRSCSALIRWLEGRLGDRLTALPYQEPGTPERFGLDRSQVETAVWTIEASGERRSGAAAINRLLVELGGPWREAARFLGLPGVHQAETAGYRWFSEHRHWFGRFFGPPTCHGGECHRR